MAVTLDPDLTRVPLRLTPLAEDPGNIRIGPTKSNGRTTVDYAKELDMSEENYLRDSDIYLMRYFGVMASGESKDALPTGLLSAREILTRLGDGKPALYRFTDHFEYRAAGAVDPRWNVVTGVWATVDAARGILQAPLDGGVENLIRFQGYPFYRASLPSLHVRVSWTDVTNAPVSRFGFRDAAGNEGFGVEWSKAASNFFRAYRLTGGAYTYAASTTVAVDSTFHDLRVELSGTVGAYVVTLKIAGVTAATVASGAVALAALSSLMTVGSGAAAAKKCNVDVASFGADFSQTDA